MTKPGIGQLGLVLCASLVTAGCEMGASGKVKTAPDAATGATAKAGGASDNVKLVERDVEAPNVFKVSDKGLWDGRPSLGGVWVAHGSVKDPERVMIRNPSNGKFVVGALFRREFENPGPALQVSSDAAEALGLLAGQPQVLNVVALRREELPNGGIPADPGNPAIGDKVNDEGTQTASAAKPGDAASNAALASAAVAAAKGAPKGADAAKAPLPGAAAPAGAGLPKDMATAAAQAEVPVLPQADAQPKKKGFWPFRRKAQAAPVPPAAAVSEPAVAGSIAPGKITATAIGATTAGTAVAAAPAAAPAAPKPAKPASSLSRPYLQIGIFSVEANAEKAAKQMRGAGMTAAVKADQSSGKSFWRVVVGPSDTEAARNALAAKVKGLGYPDAYAVSR